MKLHHLRIPVLFALFACGPSGHLQATYQATDVMLGVSDTVTIDGASVVRESVYETCRLGLSVAEVEDLIGTCDGIDTVPEDASPGASCSSCQRFDLDTTVSRAGATRRLVTHWLIQPDSAVVEEPFLTLVGELNDLRDRTHAQGRCETAPF